MTKINNHHAIRFGSIVFHLFIFFISTVVSAGVVISYWGFIIFSFRRLALTALPVIPFVDLLFLGFFFLVYKKLQKPFDFLYSLKRWLLSISASAVLSVAIVSKTGDFLHIFAAWIITTLFFWVLFWLLSFSMTVAKKPLVEMSMYWLLALMGLIGFSIFIYAGYFDRMYSEDFCYFLLPLQQGLFTALWNYYLIWSGRLFGFFLVFIFVGIRGITILELLFIFFSLTLLFIRFNAGGKEKWVYSLNITGLLLLFIFSSAPDIYKAVYWISPSFVQLPTIILLPAYILLTWHFWNISEKGKAIFTIILGFAIPLLAGLTHESNTVPFLFLTTVFALIAFLNPISRKKVTLKTYAIAGIVGAITGFLVEVLSPGNNARHVYQGYPTYPTLLETAKQTITYFWEYITGGHFLVWVLVLAFLLGLIIKKPLKRKITLAGIPFLVSVVMAITAFLPAAFAMSENLPLRTQLIPTTILFYGSFFSGFLFPRFNDTYIRNFFFACIWFTLSFFSIKLISKQIEIIPPMQQYASSWDRRNQIMLNGGAVYEIPIPWDSEEQGLHCVKQYYDFLLGK